MENLLSFTKRITGINLVDYVINYIDQNMILYTLMQDSTYSINANIDGDGTCITYDITGITIDDMIRINELPTEQQVQAYGRLYTVTIDKSNINKLIVNIM